MILGSLKNTARIEEMHPLFKPFFDYIKANDLLNAELGKIEVVGDDLFINNVCLDGKTVEAAALEAHENYIDIHVLLEGAEQISWKALEDMQDVSIPYNADKDVVFFSDKPDECVALQPGQFIVVFPEDVHGPNIGSGKIRKLIAKVRV